MPLTSAKILTNDQIQRLTPFLGRRTKKGESPRRYFDSLPFTTVDGYTYATNSYILARLRGVLPFDDLLKAAGRGIPPVRKIIDWSKSFPIRGKLHEFSIVREQKTCEFCHGEKEFFCPCPNCSAMSHPCKVCKGKGYADGDEVAKVGSRLFKFEHFTIIQHLPGLKLKQSGGYLFFESQDLQGVLISFKDID